MISQRFLLHELRYGVVVCRVPAANAPGYTAACRLIARPLVQLAPPDIFKVELLGEKWPVI